MTERGLIVKRGPDRILVATKGYNRPMRSVGIRELKNRLSEYLRLVRAGEELLVTDHGRVIAQIGPPGRSAYDTLAPGVSELARRGLLRAAGRNDPDAYPRLPAVRPPGLAERLLDAERGER